MRIKESEGSGIAKDLKKFKEDIDRPLSSILTLNTVAHTVGAIGVGAQASALFGHTVMFSLAGFEFTVEAFVAVLMTLAVLILSEIIPKTIGANNWKALAPFTVSTLKVLNIILLPLIWLTQLITKGLKTEHGKSILSRTDFLAMTDAIAEGGVIKQDDSAIIRNVLYWDDIDVRSVMTPRTVLVACQENMSIQDFYNSKELRYSRVPIYGERLDDIHGYVLKDQMLDSMVKGKGDQPMASIKRKMHVIPETLHLDVAFNKLMDQKEHIALVVDEFGGVEGIITLEDIMETLLGKEIVDEYDNITDLQEEAKKRGKERLSD